VGVNVDKASNWAYRTGKGLRDLKAIQRAAKTRSLSPIVRRVARRAAGRKAAGVLWRIFK
jgi:hypothetical protein